MKRSIIDTQDGSKSIYVHEMGETYHSKFGALQESDFVYIKNGLDLFKNQSVFILEMGYGTGLNAFVTLKRASELNLNINFTTIEAYPLIQDEIKLLNYPEVSERLDLMEDFDRIQYCEWEFEIFINTYFSILKRKLFFNEVYYNNKFDLIYFDAFGYQYQPELWTTDIFKLMFNSLKVGGYLVTYACRTNIIKNLKEVGFQTQKLKGPPGKREMLRALKL